MPLMTFKRVMSWTLRRQLGELSHLTGSRHASLKNNHAMRANVIWFASLKPWRKIRFIMQTGAYTGSLSVPWIELRPSKIVLLLYKHWSLGSLGPYGKTDIYKWIGHFRISIYHCKEPKAWRGWLLQFCSAYLWDRETWLYKFSQNFD